MVTMLVIIIEVAYGFTAISRHGWLRAYKPIKANPHGYRLMTIISQRCHVITPRMVRFGRTFGSLMQNAMPIGERKKSELTK